MTYRDFDLCGDVDASRGAILEQCVGHVVVCADGSYTGEPGDVSLNGVAEEGVVDDGSGECECCSGVAAHDVVVECVVASANTD